MDFFFLHPFNHSFFIHEYAYGCNNFQRHNKTFQKRRISMNIPRIIQVLGIVFLLATSAMAEDKSWVGSSADLSPDGTHYHWWTAQNWDPVGVPEAGDNVFLYQSIIPANVDYNYVGGPVLNSLEILNGSRLWISYTDAFETTDKQVVGVSGPAYLDQRGGSNTVGTNLYIGLGNNDYGVYTIGWYALLNVKQDVVVGGSGYGVFQHEWPSYKEGLPSVYVGDNLILGDTASGSGEYHLDGGVLVVHGNEYIGLNGEGNLTQGSGIHRCEGLMTIGQYAGSNGVSSLSGGELTVQDMIIGQEGTGTFNMSGGKLTVGQVERDNQGNDINFIPAQIINNGQFNIHDGGTQATPILVRGDIINNNDFNVSNANVKFDGTFTNNGVFHSDPSTMLFTNLYIGADGYLSGEAGDAYRIAGNFSNESTQNMLWQTRNAQLFFDDATQEHQLLVNSEDEGAVITAYDDNFAWGTVDFGGEDSEAEFLSGSLALYTGSLLGLIIDPDGKVVNLSGDSNVYYIFNPTSPGANGYLNGQTYAFLSGKGQVIPVTVTPEPAAFLLYGMGGIPLALRFLRRQKGSVRE